MTRPQKVHDWRVIDAVNASPVSSAKKDISQYKVVPLIININEVLIFDYGRFIIDTIVAHNQIEINGSVENGGRHGNTRNIF